MIVVEPKNIARLVERNPLVAALVLSIVIHLGVFGGWHVGKRLGWWQHQPTWLVNLTRKLAKPAQSKSAEEQAKLDRSIPMTFVEVDPDTGFVKLLKHWAVEDCGRVINPKLVDEQIRGAIVQGIGGALFEECLYDDEGLMRNANMADYLVPMSGEMPDIEVAHVQTPTRSSQLGAKGAGEAGTAGAPAAVMNAINDALAPFKVELWSQPITPEKVLRALGRVA